MGLKREICHGEKVKECLSTSYASDNGCGPGEASNPEMAAPVSNSSASVVVPTGDASEGTIIAEPQPAASGESTPVLEVSATPPTDAAAAVVEAPAPEASTTRS